MSKRILICPLDWGLGHATRCIPVIQHLLRGGHEVMIAGSGASLELLRIEFPSLRFFNIPTPPTQHYSRWPITRLLLQSFKLSEIIRIEQRETARIVASEKIDRIISDNRYGCRHDSVRSAIIIHQLSLKGPALLRSTLTSVNQTLINRFAECWVPDTPDQRLSGTLSSSTKIQRKFIGPLSRMRKNGTTTSFELLGLISGPEPARTHFDELLTARLQASGRTYRIVRGIVDPLSSSSSRDSYSHLPSSPLNELMEAAEVVICRSGYSTIMDLAALNKKAIFVPTPGQPEQSYLADEMERKKIAPKMSQEHFNLDRALEQLNNYTGFTGNYFDNNLLETTLREFLD